jgi:hypothetical protein
LPLPLTGCIHYRMSQVLTVRIAADLLSRADARAARLGLDRARYVRSLIEQDLLQSEALKRGQFASEDLVGALRLDGEPATNRKVRENLRRRARSQREANR